MTTRILSEEDLLDRFNFWVGLFGFKIERSELQDPDENSYTDFECYNEDNDTMVYVCLELEDFARTVKVLKPWEELAKQETVTTTSNETSSVS